MPAAPRSSASAPPRSSSRSAPAGCRWPTARPRLRARRRKYSEAQIEQLAAYIQSIGGGPEVPAGRLDDGDLALGGDLFRTNCASCHNFAGRGGALTRSKYAPALTEATAGEIYTAMQSGPENMPRFTDNQLTPDEKRAIVRYVRYVTQRAEEPRRCGPGRLRTRSLRAWRSSWSGMGLVILVTLWIGARA